MVFNWDNNKNLILKKERNISFEEIVIAIESGYIVDVLTHPKIEKYKNQILILVHVNDYVYAVPAVLKEKEFFLKTVYPSRKYTEKYLNKRRK